MSAAAVSADAEIIYTPQTGHFTSGRLLIDLDQNGTADFELAKHSVFNTFSSGGFARLQQLTVGADFASGSVIASNGSAAALMYGGLIGSVRKFHNAHTRRANMAFFDWAADSSISAKNAGGNWINTQNRYLGVRFKINGATHYGWIRCSVQNTGNNTLATSIDGFAYETTPDQSLLAGQTAEGQFGNAANASGSLGQLAQGAATAKNRRGD